MAVVDTSGIAYFLPVIAFLLVTFIVYAALIKLKLFESAWPTAFVALFVATMFITLAGSIDYIKYITGWIAVLFVSIIFILAIIGLFGKSMEGMTKGFGIGFLAIAVLIFLISGIIVYSSYIKPYLPGGSTGFSGWLYSSRVLGAILLLVVSAIAAWILSKSK